jgi:hypothetical protein
MPKSAQVIFTQLNRAAALYLFILAWQFWHYVPHAINIGQRPIHGDHQRKNGQIKGNGFGITQRNSQA